MKIRWKDHYFIRLFLPMLLLSIIPAVLLMFFLNTIYSRSQYRYVAQESEMTARQVADSISELLDGYDEIVQSIVQDPQIQHALHTRSNSSVITATIAERMFRMKGRIEIHLISFLDNDFRFSSGTIPHLYRYSVYHQWLNSVFYDIKSSPYQTIVHPTRYTNVASDSVVLSMARAVWDENQMVGCVIIDIYRSEFYDMIKSYRSPDTQRIAVFYQTNYVMLDTSNGYQEGLVDPAMNLPQLLPGAPFSIQTPGQTSSYYRGINSNLTVLNECGTSIQAQAQKTSRMWTLPCLLIDVTVCLAAALLIARRQTEPFHEIRSAMESAAVGNWDVRLSLHRTDEMKVLEDGFNNMVSQLQQYTEERIAQERLLKEAQMRSLQAQINPHFLLNTLATVRALARKHGAKDIQQIVDDLSALFTYSAYGADKMITLEEDIRLIQRYIAIQNVRFGNKFDLQINIPDTLKDVLMPPLVLQTIVENSIIHGLENKMGPGTISIAADRVNGQYMHIIIHDDGQGMESAVAERINAGKRAGDHIGLQNARQRLQLCFGEGSQLWLESELGKYTTVHIFIKAIISGEWH